MSLQPHYGGKLIYIYNTRMADARLLHFFNSGTLAARSQLPSSAHWAISFNNWALRVKNLAESPPMH